MVSAVEARSAQSLRRTRQPANVVKPRRVGPVDGLPAEEILALIPALPQWKNVPQQKRGTVLRAAAAILDWLRLHPGDGWQARWEASGADTNTQWLDGIVADDPRTPGTKRTVMTQALAYLLLCRVALPQYEFFSRYRARSLFQWAREVCSPELFVKLEQTGRDQRMQESQLQDGLRTVTKMVMHTGRNVDQLTAHDVQEHREWFYRGLRGADRGVHAAWDLLQGIGVLAAEDSLGSSLRRGQQTTDELVDFYRLQCDQVRDVLIRYLNERRASLDYSSFKGLAMALAGLFWSDIERHHPGLDTLKLPVEVAEQWKQRIRVVTNAKGEARPRKGYHTVLAKVRAFYLDIQEWALEDPSWAQWAAPSPVRRADLAGMGKERKKTVSAMHQRVRERLPHLPTLLNSAEDHKDAQARFLKAAEATPVGATFRHDGATYLRTHYKTYPKNAPSPRRDIVLVENVETGQQIDIGAVEDDAFWTWAIIETLHRTGIRIEELLEITHLALVSYRLPDTGEVIPLLQIVPSKNNEERVLLIDPDLASVLAAIVKRLRDNNGGKIPLVARYDLHEKITNPKLPHLFQRTTRGWQSKVMSPMLVRRMLTDAIDRAGLCDNTGQPLRYTPHDFRRMFTTEAVTGGLPVHIAAKLLGHHDLSTTQAYLAVFQDDLIRTYRAFLDKRRSVRPEAEYREPTSEEWKEFQQHFQARKLELGTCGRPYGSPCKHEHACIRCPMLRMDPRQKDRLIEIISNLTARIKEARINGWLGEVEGLETSQRAAQAKLASLNRTSQRGPAGPTDLGMPTISTPYPS